MRCKQRNLHCIGGIFVERGEVDMEIELNLTPHFIFCGGRRRGEMGFSDLESSDVWCEERNGQRGKGKSIPLWSPVQRTRAMIPVI